MYLRLAWVVGNAGVLGAILIIVLAHVVTISTGLAVSSIATNIRVGAGGACRLWANMMWCLRVNFSPRKRGAANRETPCW
jgi:hypothetical protein